MEHFMELANKFISPGIVFILTVVFGNWLSNAGKPSNGILFNIHKLIALAGAILTVVQFAKIPQRVAPISLVTLLLFLAALCVIALFVNGALMSSGKLDYALMLTIHCAALFVLVITPGLVVYWLGRSA